MEVIRKLASVREVGEIETIKGADRIEGIHVDGWTVVVKKNIFKKGDLGVFFEIDSILPPSEKYSFLESNKWRIRTVKMQNYLSQGLFLSFEELGLDKNDFKVGDDLTGILDVRKHQPKVKITSEVNAILKEFLPIPPTIERTSEERIQNDLKKLEYEYPVYETEKIDGTSFTVYYDEEEEKSVICSHHHIRTKFDGVSYELNTNTGDPIQITKSFLNVLNGIKITSENATNDFIQDRLEKIILSHEKKLETLELALELSKPVEEQSEGIKERLNDLVRTLNHSFVTTFEKNNLHSILKENKEIVIQGEIIGQQAGGTDYLDPLDNDFFVFNIKNKKGNTLWSLDDMLSFCEKYELTFVPVISRDKTLKEICNNDFNVLIEKVNEEMSTVNENVISEGRVIRSMNPKDRFSFKVISNNYLLKKEMLKERKRAMKEQ